jgi:sugar/nucleoside kinase (ribokinase family)
VAKQIKSIPEVIVAGHICLDIIPSLEQRQGSLDKLLVPGTLVKVGPAVVSTGGAVSNTGIALHRLGVPTRLMGKVGDDILGRAILDVLRSHSPALADGMIVARGEPSSYTVVISPPGVDRMFLHCPGANDTFGADDVAYARLDGARLFHFGYPPIMRRMYQNGGRELATMFRRVKSLGITTSLDMTMIDPESEAGRVDWRALLRRVLPHVDVFLPSFDEMQLMLNRKGNLSPATLREMADELLAMGCAIVGLKLGDQGLYVRTTNDAKRISPVVARASRLRLNESVGNRKRDARATESWLNRELLAPCFKVNVVGTTGSGDCTIAGFLAGLLKGLPLEEVMTAAVAVGACCCEKPDATSGIIPWAAVQRRIKKGWERREASLHLR